MPTPRPSRRIAAPQKSALPKAGRIRPGSLKRVCTRRRPFGRVRGAMTTPVVAPPKPCLVNLKGGRTYFWCSCGRSANQPFCDGSHKGTGFEPLKFTATPENTEVLLCGCKHTATPPYCDGAHTNLPGGSPLDDPQSPENCKIPVVTERVGARAALNGDCYVISPRLAEMATRGHLRYCYLVTGELGSLYQTQALLEVTEGPSPVLSLGDREVILFIGAGRGTVTLSGQRFSVQTTDGVYVRPSEGLQIEAAAG